MGALARSAPVHAPSPPEPSGARVAAPAHLLVVDRRPLVCAGVARLGSRGHGGPAHGVADLEEARAVLRRTGCANDAVLLLGIQPGDDPALMVEQARRLASRVICLLSAEDAAVIHAALAAEADGYLMLELLDRQSLRAALAAVQAGERAIPPELGGPCHQSHVRSPTVTVRCLDVLRLLADGLHDQEIATRLGISSSSVRKHISSAQERLGGQTRTQTLAIAVRRGLL
jgi:DNA-binding NarL/FixJ family response regulator